MNVITNTRLSMLRHNDMMFTYNTQCHYLTSLWMTVGTREYATRILVGVTL